ncbi:EamA family transporter [Staphylococcus aureus]
MYFTFQKKYIEKYGFITSHTIYNNGKLTIYAYFYSSVTTNTRRHFYINSIGTLFSYIPYSIIPYVLLAYIVKSVGVSDATMSLYLTPIVSLLLSYLLLDELPTTLAIL